MLHHAERGGVPEQPAGKDPAPFERSPGAGAFLDEDLGECPGFGRCFPGQGSFTGGKPHDDIADPSRLAGLEHDVLGQVVALVEQPQRRDTIPDRRAIFALDRHPRRCRHLADRRRQGLVAILAGIVAARQKHKQPEKRGALHAQASGDQAS